MIPIGAPVTVTMPPMYNGPRRYHGTITAIIPQTGLGNVIVDAGNDDEIYAFWNEVKIRYDNQCPFTLWSWNTELKLDANAPWYSMFGDLNPKSITDYRKVVASWGKIS